MPRQKLRKIIVNNIEYKWFTNGAKIVIIRNNKSITIDADDVYDYDVERAMKKKYHRVIPNHIKMLIKEKNF